MTKIKKQKTVYVGVSGGVDSSVSLALLKKQGYNVVGVFIKTWQPDFIECTWKEERRDAMRACAHVGVPFKTFDAEKAYKEGVANYMIDEYKKGRTPNPDVMCNREVKFGVFLKWALKNGADFVATGHYAINQLKINNYQLIKAKDENKDQVYFLWKLTQADLKHILFPIGHMLKTEVRKLAQKYKLPTALKKDSQGVCFLGPLDMKDFLAHFIKNKKGKVLSENGVEIGEHNGALFFTLGERHGFKIFDNKQDGSPYFVIAKDTAKNTITVSHNKFATDAVLNILNLENINWITSVPKLKKKYTLQIRYHSEFIKCEFLKIVSDTAQIKIEKPQIISPGQSIVIYDKSICLGGGVLN